MEFVSCVPCEVIIQILHTQKKDRVGKMIPGISHWRISHLTVRLEERGGMNLVMDEYG